jgi:hypothetical protein
MALDRSQVVSRARVAPSWNIGAAMAELKSGRVAACRSAHTIGADSAMAGRTSPAHRRVPMIESMNRGLDLHYGAVIVGVFVDQIGSFAMGLAIAVGLPLLGLTIHPGGPNGHGNANLAQALYEASCIVFGVAGGYQAARLAGRSMVAHGVAVGVTSLGVSTALGVAMNQELFDARGIFFAAVALVAGSLGGWLASLRPARRPQPTRA